ncbi:MAG TPA: cobalamin-dependent protein [Planctomycetota bacterium]|nr:cobalamin-dependent protein [Planctomycetota bacterium]
MKRMHLELSYAENFRPPLGLAYCAAVLEQHGHDVRIVDALVEGLRHPALRRLLLRERPDVVGLSIDSPTRLPESPTDH